MNPQFKKGVLELIVLEAVRRYVCLSEEECDALFERLNRRLRPSEVRSAEDYMDALGLEASPRGRRPPATR